MIMTKAVHFFLLLFILQFSLYDTHPNIPTTGPEEACADELEGLRPIGPCEQTLLYCKAGLSSYMECPPSMVFNPSSGFCEKPEHFLQQQWEQNAMEQQAITPLPIVNEVDGALPAPPLQPSSASLTPFNTQGPQMNAFQSVPSDSPDNQIRPSQVFHHHHSLLNDLNGKQSGPSYSVFVQPGPVVEQYIEEGNDQAKDRAYPYPDAAFIVTDQREEEEHESDRGEPLREEGIPIEEEYQFVDESKSEVDGGEEPLVDRFIKSEQPMPTGHSKQEYKEAEGDAYASEDSSEQIHDQFMMGGAKAYEQEESKPIVDQFKGRKTYEPVLSEFMPINEAARAGHDAFKSTPHAKPVQSEFAPMNTPIEAGHDIFATRHKKAEQDIYKIRMKRMAENANDNAENGTNASAAADKCRSLYAQLNRTTSSMNFQTIECVADQFAHGCRPYYIACVQGRLVQRYCPLGLFFDVARVHCERRELVAHCARIQAQQMSVQGETEEGQQKKQQNVSVGGHRRVSPAKNVNNTRSGVSSPKAQLPDSAHLFPGQFCAQLPDNFYRHPQNCSRIIQCYGHEMFEYPSCLHGLAFDERTNTCQYANKVPGCDESNERDQPPNVNNTTDGSLAFDDQEMLEQADDAPAEELNGASIDVVQQKPSPALRTTCRDGHSHGDHIADPNECTLFHRCVWGSLVQMSCPSGTAFNPRLSVCDHRDRVPQCQK